MTKVLGKNHVVSGKSSLPCAFILINYIEEAVSLLRQLNSAVLVAIFFVFPVFLVSKFLSNSFLGSWSVSRVSTILWICEYFAYVWVSHSPYKSVYSCAQLCKRHWVVTWFTFWPAYIWSSLYPAVKFTNIYLSVPKIKGSLAKTLFSSCSGKYLPGLSTEEGCLPLITWELFRCLQS